MTRRSSVLLSVGAALIAALAVAAIALATQRSHDDHPPAKAKAATGNAAQPRIAGPMMPPPGQGSTGHLRVKSPVTLEARTPDPLGGPDWVVRVATTQAAVPTARGGLNVEAPQRCAQLGRLVNDRFGWVDGNDVFHPVPIDSTLVPIICASTSPGQGHDPQVNVANRVAKSSQTNAHLIQTVVWGLAGASAQSTVTVDGHDHPAASSQDGVFVVPVAASAHRPDVHLAVRYADGLTATADDSYRADSLSALAVQARLWRQMRVHPKHPAPAIPPANAQAVVDARYADPDGGLPYAMLAIRCGGDRWCPSELGNVVGDRVGMVREPAGLFADEQASPNFGIASSNPQPTKRRPLVFDTGESAFRSDGTQAPGALRAQQGTTTIEGVADPSVKTITIVSPRDTRTIVPSLHAHAFAAVYDGRFAAGRFTMTAKLADGRTYREKPFSPNYP